jgi:hypothetical protein
VVGVPAELGAGGALFVAETQLRVNASRFLICAAGTGGAIAGVASDCVLSQSLFEGCRAMYQGGAVAFSYSLLLRMNSYAIDRLLFVSNCTFNGCKARESGGAVGITGFDDVTFDRCSFRENKAAAIGGAVDATDSNLLMFKSHFVDNTVGGWSVNECRGGAVSFFSQSVTAGDHNNMTSFQLSSEDCCFVGNAINSTRGRGLDVFVGGIANYQSYNDSFLNYANVSIFANSTFRQYFGRFYDSGRFFSAECPAELYQSAYSLFSRSFFVKEMIDYTPLVGVANNDTQEGDVSAPVNSPWATMVPAATPLGQTARTVYTLYTNLSVPSFIVHSPATASAGFSYSESFVVFVTGRFADEKSAVLALSKLFQGSQKFTIDLVALEPEGRPPQFDSGTGEPTGGHYYNIHYHIFDNITGEYSRHTKYDRLYRECLVHVVGCTFMVLSALGSVPETGFGGALYLSRSQLYVSGSQFFGCQGLPVALLLQWTPTSSARIAISGTTLLSSRAAASSSGTAWEVWTARVIAVTSWPSLEGVPSSDRPHGGQRGAGDRWNQRRDNRRMQFHLLSHRTRGGSNWRDELEFTGVSESFCQLHCGKSF